jgi:hypothetical protein
LQNNRLSNGILGDPPQRIFSTIFKDQFNGACEILPTFFDCTALSISAWYLRAICDESLFVLLYDCSEFIMHNNLVLSFPLV